MRTFTDRVVALTGAGSGIGKALAFELARRGADLALADIDDTRLDPVASELRALGRTVSVHRVDVGARAELERYCSEVLSHHGKVHALFNNAGISVTGSFESTPAADFDRLLDVNLFGVVNGTRVFLPHLRRNDAGHVVIVSSVFGLVGMPSQSAYCASKAAVRMFGESLAAELRGSSVGVSVVHPGGVATRIAEDAVYHQTEQMDPGRAKRLIARGLPPEKAAVIIADGVLANRERILVGPDARALDWLQRVAPVGYRSVVLGLRKYVRA